MSTDDEKRERLQASSEASPLEHPWGVLTTDWWPSGVKLFHWYTSPASLRDSLLSGDHALDTESGDWPPIDEALRALLAGDDPIRPERLDAFNEAVDGAFKVLWWGQFDELCSGDGEVPRDVREAFLSSGDDAYDFDAPPRALDATERDAFAEFLTEWGV